MHRYKPIATMVMAACLLGAAADPGSISPRDPYPIDPSGPTCYGQNYDYHVWNLLNPQDVYGIDSCKITQLIAARTVAGNYSQFVTLLAIRYPKTIWPASVMILIWNANTGMIQTCAAHGTGVELLKDSRTGWTQGCRAQ